MQANTLATSRGLTMIAEMTAAPAAERACSPNPNSESDDDNEEEGGGGGDDDEEKAVIAFLSSGSKLDL